MAIMMRFGAVPWLPGTSIISINQRSESLSYRMRGSEEKFFVIGGVITEVKNESLVTFMALSLPPVALMKERIRPLRLIMNWVGPADPMVSGGKPEHSGKDAAR